MRELLLLRFKSQRYMLPLLVLVAVLMVVLGQTAADALSGRQPSLSLALQQEGNSAASAELVQILKETAHINVVEREASESAESVFDSVQVQGLVVVPEDFGELLEAGKRPKVRYYPAPGVSDSSFGVEQVADAIMRLQTRSSLEQALTNMDAQDALDSLETQTEDLLEVVYEGPALSAQADSDLEVWGVSALLLLLAWLHAALLVPGPDSKRVQLHGRDALTRHLVVSLLVVWILWILLLVLYLVFLWASSGHLPSVQHLCGFVAIIFYVSSMATLCVQAFGRTVTTWLFLPLFGLSMTIGGGLWGQAVAGPLLAPLTPVTVVVTGGPSTWLGIALLAALAVFALGVTAALLRRRMLAEPKPHTDQHARH